MVTFNYELPGEPVQDPWQQLSPAAQSALGRAGDSTSQASELLAQTAEAGAGSDDTAEANNRWPVPDAAGLGSSALNWAHVELADGGDNSRLARWRKYKYALSQEAPQSFDDLLQKSPNLEDEIIHLYTALGALRASKQLTPAGIPLHEAMAPVLVPWETFQENLDRLPAWLSAMRQLNPQLALGRQDIIEQGVLAACNSSTVPLYRHTPTGKVGGIPLSLTATVGEYIRQRKRQQGEWGIALAQTGTPGLMSLVQSDQFQPDALTNRGHDRLRINGVNVDGMGIIEWLSVLLQEFHSTSEGWLPANRMTEQVPFSRQEISTVPLGVVAKDYTSMYPIESTRNDQQPRLGVV